MAQHTLLSLLVLVLIAKPSIAECQENCNTALTRIAKSGGKGN
jgi:hypothetical protein